MTQETHLGDATSHSEKSPSQTPSEPRNALMDKPILLPTPIYSGGGSGPGGGGGGGGGGHARRSSSKLTLVPLIFIIFFEVAGGPYGAEPAVQAAGPLFALIGFLVFPFVWAIPESLVTAELATALPGNGGFVVWADRAFGPFAGSLMGTWKYVSGAINGAAFPALCADYLARVVPAVAGGRARVAAIVTFNVALSFLNYTGLSIVGWTAVALGLASLSPFLLMSGIAIPKLRPRRWLATAPAAHRNWKLFFNTLFWNLNYWDSASTMAGEVERPGKTFPKALVAAVAMTSLGYLLPLMAATGAIDAPYDAWVNGFFADAAGSIGGKWLKYWIEVGAVLSTIGLYEATLSSAAFQLLGMADLGLLPRCFALRAPVFNTPWVGIVFSSLITFAMSFLSFDDIVASANFLYSLGMLLEFAAFLSLRARRPDLHRPYRVPLRLPGLVLMCLLPSAFLLFVMAIAGWKVYVVSALFTALGVAVHYLMAFCKSKGLLKFGTAHQEAPSSSADGV